MEPWNSETLHLFARARALTRDSDSGATEITTRLLSLLADALRIDGNAPLEIARIVLTGQPAMAPLWHACAAAVAERESPGTFDRVRARMLRAPGALTRAAAHALGDLLTGDDTPRLLTVSYSSSVAAVLRAVAAARTIGVVCGEGRPRFEGRRLARELAEGGLQATLVVDAALTAMMPASAVVMGADAVTPDYWTNKVGSLGLAAAAARLGVPVYVIASRDKIVPLSVEARMMPPAQAADEVWPDHPRNVAVANLYFERIPLELSTLVLTDTGPMGPGDVGAAVSRDAGLLSRLVAELF